MRKVLVLVVLSLGLASCGGSADAATGDSSAVLAAPAEAGGDGCCGGCASEGAAPAAEACCEGEAKGGGCCSEGLSVPPAEAKKPDGKN